MSYYVYEAGNCQYCGKHLGTQEAQGGRHRQYCSDKCRKAASRERKAKRDDRLSRNGKPRQQIEREEAQALHYMRCDCGRGIWTVRGNVQIGGLVCALCHSEFRGG